MFANHTINGFYSPALQDLYFSCSQTQVEDDPWWHVNLDRQYPILEIGIGTNVESASKLHLMTIHVAFYSKSIFRCVLLPLKCRYHGYKLRILNECSYTIIPTLF